MDRERQKYARHSTLASCGPDKLLSCCRRVSTITEGVTYDSSRIHRIAISITEVAMSHDRGNVSLRHCHLYMQIGYLDKSDR